MSALRSLSARKRIWAKFMSTRPGYFPAKIEGRLGVRRISDGNFTAPLGVPTLDGLGIDGDGAHTEWEHGLISSIDARTRLMRGLLETLQ